MAEPGPGPPLRYSRRLEPLSCLGSDAVVASKSDRKIRPFLLERPGANEE